MSTTEAEVLPAVTESNGGYSALLDRALTSGASPEIWDKILTLQERWERMQARKIFDDALAKAKAELPIIIKDKQVDFQSTKGGRIKYLHETLPAMVEAITPTLAKHGLSFRFRVSNSLADNNITVTCILYGHGYSEDASTLTAKPDETGNKNDIQGLGSAQTYLSRYCLRAALGLAADEDDDGRATGKRDDDDPRITEKQVERIAKLLAGSTTSRTRFLQWANVENISEIRESYYDSCVENLEQLQRSAAKK
jgi:hypothetical protein